MTEGLAVPVDVLWKLGTVFLAALGGAYLLLMHTVWRMGGKMDRVDCLQRHSELGQLLAGMVKDIEYLVKENGGTPAAKTDSHRQTARKNRQPRQEE